MAIEKFSGKFTKEDGGCTIVINETINLIQNSDALALYIYLACRPTSWDLHFQNIMKHFSWGKNKTYRILHILQNLYLLKKIEHRESGKIIKHEYILMLRPFSPLPQNEEVDVFEASSESSPLPQNREVVTTSLFARSGEMNTHIKQRELENKENKNKYNKKAINPVEYQETYFPQTQSHSKKLTLEKLTEQNPHQIPITMIQDWMENRKAKKVPVTQTAWNSLTKELGKCEDPIAAFETMVTSGWQSFKADWVNKKHGAPTESYFDNESIEWGKNINQEIF